MNHEFFHIHYAGPLRQVELLTKGYLPLAKFKGQVDKIFFITKKGMPENGEIKIALPFLKPAGYGFLEMDLSRVRLVFTKNFEVEKDEVDIGIMYNETWEQIDDKKEVTIAGENVIETHNIFMVHKSVYQMLKPIFLSLEEMEEATVEDVKKAESIIRKIDILSQIWQLGSIAKPLMTSPFIGVLIYRDKIIYANDYVLSLIGIDREELSTINMFDLISGVEDENLKKTIIENLNKRLKGEHSIYVYDIIPFKNKKGELIYLKSFSDTVLYMGDYAGISFFVDNTKRIRLENLYNLVRQINEAITKSTLEEEFFEKVVKALVEKIDLELVWIGKEEKDRIVPIYADGRAKGYLENINISILESSEESNDPTDKAYREGEVVINPDSSTSQMVRPWRDNLLKFQLLSSVAIPLKKDGKIEYVLNMYSKYKDFFQDENKEILYEIKNDIEYFLSEIEIRRKSIIIGEALKSSKSWVLITDENCNITYVNDFVCEMSGYTKEELIGKIQGFLNRDI
ncbi:MAG: PAS domain S-box protein [Hydrogenothermaceae bacterium]|nr:PAS domain S-box protein [Hydrogenothermaceae bacterium]